MLDKEKLEKEANNAVNWIKEYVEKVGAKGVIVRQQWWKRFGYCYRNGNKSPRKEKSFNSRNAMQFDKY